MSIVISGATGGIGTEVSKLFASKGQDLILLGQSMSNLKALYKSLDKSNNASISLICCDINHREELTSCIKEINEVSENVSLLLNIAGVFSSGPLLEEKESTFDECMDVNLRLPYLLSLGLFDSLKKEGGGKIINIGSSSSYSGFKNTVTYCASKHALLGFSRALHDEWKDYGISVHCISPGSVSAGMSSELSQDKTTYIEAEQFAEFIYDVSRYSGNMVIEEVQVARRIIR
ncbi:SDR family oxidoreductase [SAR86 cluster bacterium]|nr:SDR family oxidoreductase [SAR86 cluster bacterium]